MVAITKVDANPNADRLFRLFDENADDATHIRAVIAEGGADLWLAEIEGRLVGALPGRQMRSSDGALQGGVDNLLVDERHRRQGIGRRLMEAAERFYRGQGLYGMQLALSAENATACALYDSMGYRVVRQYTRTRRSPAGTEVVQQRLQMWKEFGMGASE